MVSLPRLLPLLWMLLVGVLYASPGRLAAQAPEESLRVRLLVDAVPRTLRVTAEGGAAAVYAGDQPATISHLNPGEAVVLGRRENEVHATFPDLGLFALSLRLVPEANALLRVEVLDGTRNVEPRGYDGALRVDVAGGESPVLRLVNEIPLDAYVAAVVAREYGFDDGEGVKAMAVLARTYALRNPGKFGSDYDFTDQTLSQKYDGTDRLTEAALDAVHATRGEVLTYEGDLIEAVYFSSSGGHTADNDAVWEGQPLPYLRGVPDPFDAVSPYRGWRSSVPRASLLERLSSTYGFPVDGFHLGPRGSDGRVHSIELLRDSRTARIISSNEFRLFVNRHFGYKTLLSTLFDARREGDHYVFTGDGFGHGVGLSQWGAHAMAQRGYSYREILAYYFSDTRLAHVDGSSLEPTRIEDLAVPSGPTWSETPSDDVPVPATNVSTRRRVGW